MSAANIAAISYVGLQASEFTILPMIQAASIEGLMQVHDDVMYRKQLGLLRPGKFAYRTDTGGGKSNTGGGVVGSEVWLQVERIYAQEEQDVADYFEKFLIEQARKGSDSGDLQGVAAAEQIITMYSMDRAVDLCRLIWGGNEAAVSGDFTGSDAATKATFYATVNGVLTRIMAAIADSSIAAPVTIVASPTAANVRAYFQQLWSAQGAVLRAYPRTGKQFWVDSEIMDLFLTDRESFTGSDFSFQLQDDGTEIIRFRGVELINRNEWNLMQEEGSWGSYLPDNFIFLLTRDAVAFGADTYNVETALQTWYSLDDDVNYARVKNAIGTQIVDKQVIVAAVPAGFLPTSSASSASSSSSGV